MIPWIELNQNIGDANDQCYNHHMNEDENWEEWKLAKTPFQLGTFELLSIVDNFRFGKIDQHLTDCRWTILRRCVLWIPLADSQEELSSRNGQSQTVDIDMDHLRGWYPFQAHPLTATSTTDQNIGRNDPRNGAVVLVTVQILHLPGSLLWLFVHHGDE